MKTPKNPLFLTLLALLAITGQNSLLGMKKQPKKDDFDALMKEQQKRLATMKMTEDKRKAEILKKQNDEKHKQEVIEKRLLAEYPLIKEFKLCHKDMSLCHKDTLKSYYAWLNEIKSLFLKQDNVLQEIVAYAKHFAELDVTNKQFYQAWNPYIEKIPNARFYARYPINEKNNIEEWVLGLRYINELQQGYKSFYLTAHDYALLHESLKSDATKWLATAILTTDTYFKYERESVTFCQKQSKKLSPYIELINKLPLSETTKKTWFQNLFTMISLASKNHDESMNHTENEQQFYIDIQKIYAESLEQRHLILQSYDQELEKLKNKFEPKETSKVITVQPAPKLLKKPLLVVESREENNASTTEEFSEHQKLTFTDHKTSIKKQPPTEQLSCIINLVKPSSKIPYKEVLDRVNIWYRDPHSALKNLELKYEKNVHKKHHAAIIKCHTFSDMVDYFVEPLAIKCSWEAENARQGDISYNIPGQIIDNETGEKTTGIFSYGVTQQGLLFHRCFSQRAYEKIENDIQQRVYDGLYPTLSDDTTTQNEQLKLRRVKKIEECNDLVKQNHFYVEIKDNENNMTIRLFKVKREGE